MYPANNHGCDEQRRALQSTEFYPATLFVDAEEREALSCLFLLSHEIESILWQCRSDTTALEKLRWWDEEFQRLKRGEARHPCALSAQSAWLGLNPATLDALIHDLGDMIDDARHLIQQLASRRIDHPCRFGGNLARAMTRFAEQPGFSRRLAMQIGIAWYHRVLPERPKTGLFHELPAPPEVPMPSFQIDQIPRALYILVQLSEAPSLGKPSIKRLWRAWQAARFHQRENRRLHSNS